MSRRLRYAVLGGALALGAPAGLLAVRGLTGGLSPRGMLREIERDAATFAYVTLSTMAAFAVFGGVLGGREDRLEAQAQTDVLTGILNRRAVQDRLEQELARAARHGQALALLLIDVDRLKDVNDRAGHRAGDQALCGTAAAITAAARLDDVCGRWGGDEFVVLAPATKSDDAVRLAERIRARAAQAVGGAAVTVSIGVATFEGGVPRGQANVLVSEADAALYEAKERGRNRVAVFHRPGTPRP